MEKLTNHHVFNCKKGWRQESRAHKRLVNHRAFLIPMRAVDHNHGKDSLHYNVSNVPLITVDQARQLVTDVSDCLPGEWLRNMDTAIASLYNISEADPDMTNGDIAHWAAENLVAQRQYVARSVGHSATIHIMG